jgi:tRNA threonylcarbamoyladenosine biosynthesis protein TsaB
MKDLILAVDCSLQLTNVALLSILEEGVFVSERLDIGRRQAAELPLAAERLLANAGRSFGDIALVAVTNGPGYFTGIRVGASYATALAYGLGVKIVPVSTLHMLAYPFLGSRPVISVVYAGRGQVYAASFGCACLEEGKEALPAGEYESDVLGAWLSRRKGASVFPQDLQDLLLVSDDPEKVASISGLPKEIHPKIRRAIPDAANVARISAQAAKRGESISPMELSISYHRLPQTGGYA